MKYIKYLKHLVANYPISSLLFSLFIILFFWALFYYRKSIINIVANNFPHSKTKTKIMYVAIFGSFVVSFLYFTNYISNPFKSENCSISKSNYLYIQLVTCDRFVCYKYSKSPGLSDIYYYLFINGNKFLRMFNNGINNNYSYSWHYSYIQF